MIDGTVGRVCVAAWLLLVARGSCEPSDVHAATAPTSAVQAAAAPRDGGEDVSAPTGAVGRAAGGVARFGGLGGSFTNQTVITSRQLLYDYRRSIAMFEGNVVVTDPQIRITSDRLIVVFGVSNEVQSVTALDDVKIFNADREGSCERAVYKVPAGEIMLTGSPVLRRERDVLKGERITFWTDREVVVCEPGELILTPESAKVKP
jgi:lipopolysaccharide export system protein LptA